MENINTEVIGYLLVSLIVSFVLCGILVSIYNLFIGLPRGIKIKKEKKYKTVPATVVIHGSTHATEINYDKSGVFEYEWEVDGKKYKRIIRSTQYQYYVDKLYYLDNPKYAKTDPIELGRFKYTVKLFFILFVIVYLFVSNGPYNF